MKFSPTVTLAVALAAGLSGTAMAQGTTAPGAAPSSPQSSLTQPAQPQAQPTPMQPGQMQQGQVQQGQVQQGLNAPPANANPGMQAAPAQGRAAANDQVRQAQQQLQAAGLYNGPVDGIMDPDTRAALARFQQQNGLRRSEDLDQPTLARLMSQQTTGSGSTAAAGQPVPNGGPRTAAPPTGAGGNAPAGQPMPR